jgi:hypothetical protein
MSDTKRDSYTQNLVVKPRRKPVEINPETEESFEESKELIKESFRQAARTNMAFVAWMGIFSWRLIKHVVVSLWAKHSARNKDKQKGTSRPFSPGQRYTHTTGPRPDRKDRSKKS